VRGANGVVYYSFFDMMSGCHRTGTCPLDVSNMTQWARLSTIAAEVERFAPVLLSDAGPAPAVTVLNTTGGVPGWVATREQWDDADASALWIFAANDGNGGGAVSFILGGGLLATGGSVEVVSETPVRSIALKAGSDRFVDASHTMHVAVYKLHTIRSKTDDREMAQGSGRVQGPGPSYPLVATAQPTGSGTPGHSIWPMWQRVLYLTCRSPLPCQRW
jgi:hypothetical protein